MDVPGVKPDHLTIQLEQNGQVLHLSGDRKTTKKTDTSFEESEFKFDKRFTLDKNLDTAKMTAHLADGVLTLTGKSAFVLFCLVLSCVQYEDSVIWMLFEIGLPSFDCFCKPRILTDVTISSETRIFQLQSWTRSPLQPRLSRSLKEKPLHFSKIRRILSWMMIQSHMLSN